MTDTATTAELDGPQGGELKRSITGKLLFFYVLGDVLGSGIYVLIGLVAGAVGGAFWIAFAVGVTVATITGLAYAELVTKYPQAAGAALYVNKAFRNRPLTFLITVACSPPASRPRARWPPASRSTSPRSGTCRRRCSSAWCSSWCSPIVNFIGITESVVANMADDRSSRSPAW